MKQIPVHIFGTEAVLITSPIRKLSDFKEKFLNSVMMMMNNDDKYSIFTQTATAAKIRNNKILEKVGEISTEWWKNIGGNI